MKSEYQIKKKFKEIENDYNAGNIELCIYESFTEAFNWVLQGDPIETPFDDIWDIYTARKPDEKRIGPRFSEKAKAKNHWTKMSTGDRKIAVKYADKFIKTKQFDTWKPPALIRYLKGKRWEEVLDAPCQNHEEDSFLQIQRESWSK
jgi:hypothetical protein